MSVFNESDDTVTLETLVGDDKKYKSPDELAKAYRHADATIAQRNQELADLREELAKRTAAEDILRQIRESRVETPDRAPREDTPPVVAPSQDDLVSKIREITQAEKQREAIERNVEFVASELVKTYGDEAKANAVVRAKAAELGVSVDFLQEVAAKSPKAFFAQLGLNNTPTPSGGNVRSDVNTEVLRNSNNGVKENTYKWYQELRKNDTKTYYSPRIQNQMYKDASRLGDAFYN